jgi:hypothetical protein
VRSSLPLTPREAGKKKLGRPGGSLKIEDSIEAAGSAASPRIGTLNGNVQGCVNHE